MAREQRVHGDKGIYCSGDWIPIEDCANWSCPKECNTVNKLNTNPTKPKDENNTKMYDVLIIGGGCIGASIARELSKYLLSVILIERDDDVSQGATKANSGVIHAGYDDKPTSIKSQFCWNGNQMFSLLDSELKFGFKRNGSLVIAKSDEDILQLNILYRRGIKNGVKNLRIIFKKELQKMEPYLSSNCIAALYSPDAGIISPFEFTAALIENAAMNGVEIRTRHEVIDINYNNKFKYFMVDIEQLSYYTTSNIKNLYIDNFKRRIFVNKNNNKKIIQIKTKYIINCGGLFADKIAPMINDYSFIISPRLGEYLILNKNQNYLTRCSLFECPTKKGKGVLVQNTLWGNLMLGPTSRDNESNMSNDDIVKFILLKSKELIPNIDETKIINSFTGSRPKSSKNDWIIKQTEIRNKFTKNKINFFNVAGIDSPGLAASPAIAIYVVNLLKKCGLNLIKNKLFNGYRKPIIIPKYNWNNLQLKKFINNKYIESNLNENECKKNVICICEKVTEYEIIDSMNRFGVCVDTTQAIRRRTRAGMGQCQARYCEKYVAKIISKKKHIKIDNVGTRPWPATSILNNRWLNNHDKNHIQSLINTSKL